MFFCEPFATDRIWVQAVFFFEGLQVLVHTLRLTGLAFVTSASTAVACGTMRVD